MKVLKKLSALLIRKGYNKTFREQVEASLEKSLCSGEHVLRLVEGKDRGNFVFLLATDLGVLYMLTDTWPEAQIKRIAYTEVISAGAVIGNDLRICIELESAGEKYKVSTYNLRSALGFLKTIRQMSRESVALKQLTRQTLD